MFKDEEERWARYFDLTQIMENVPPKQPSEGFAARVMALLPERKANVRQFSLHQFFGAPAFATNIVIDFRSSVQKTECAFYFFLTGFFYLVLGIILMLGLAQMTTGLPFASWLKIQTFFYLLEAFCLTALGAILYIDGTISVRIARIRTVLYAVLVIMNGLTGVISTHFPAAIFFSSTFAVGGMIMAAFLGIAVDHYAPEPISSQGGVRE
jgi:hypothetical protein